MFYYYILTVFLCLVVSLINKTARQRFFWSYFLIVFITEVLIYKKVLNSSVYNWISLFYMSFFFYIYKKDSNNKLFFNILWFASFSFTIILIFKKGFLGTDADVFQSFVYIFLTINWFFKQIKNPNEYPIKQKINFWMSISILFWSILFVFRLIPTYFFEKNDIEFLYFLNNLYQGATIFSYIIFLRGLFCKQ